MRAILLLKKCVQFFLSSKEVNNLSVKLDIGSTTEARQHANKCKNKQFLRVKRKIRAKACLEQRRDCFFENKGEIEKQLISQESEPSFLNQTPKSRHMLAPQQAAKKPRQ